MHTTTKKNTAPFCGNFTGNNGSGVAVQLHHRSTGTGKMKSIPIFKTGRHTASDGTTLDYGESLLQNAVAVYDPKIHEAPIVIGHPRDNGPAYGWVGKLNLNAGNVTAEPKQVNADFEEMVKTGSFKKVSASWYLPDSPTNPVPGSLYLRHVGFLGAQPPAIKGLPAVEFAEQEGTVEFEEPLQDGWNLQTIAGIFKRLREFVIEKYSLSDADNVIPDYAIQDLNDSAKNKINAGNTPADLPYPQSNYSEGEQMTPEEAQAKIAALEAANQTLTTEKSALAQRIAQFEEGAKQQRTASITAKIDALVAAGKVPAAERDQTIAFAETIAANSLEFGEGDQKKGGLDAYMATLENRKAVDFNEHSKDNSDPKVPLTAHALAAKAVEYQEQEKQAGRSITIDQAVNHITSQAE